MADTIILKHVEDIEVVLEGLDSNNITSVLDKYKEINEIRKKLDILEDMLKVKIKTFLKEKNWIRYVDEKNKMSVSLIQQKREDFNKQQLKFILTEAQYAQVIKVSSFEKLIITTPEDKERLKQYVR